MKSKVLVASVALFAALAASAEVKMPWSKTLPVEPGEWNVQYEEAMRLAKEEHIPVVAMFVRASCSKCGALETANTTEEVIQWRKDRGYIFLLGIEGDKTAGAKPSKVLSMSQKGSHLPFVGLYWDKDGDGKNDLTGAVGVKFSGRSGEMPVTKGTQAQQFMASCDKLLGAYDPVRYVGGTFTAPDEDGNRLEFEAGTKSVAIELTREKKAPEFETNMTFRVLGKDGKAIAALGRTIEWAANETNKTVALDLTKVDTSGYADGDKLTLLMIDAADGLAHATNHVTFVKQPVSSRNPLWIGERRDPRANGIAPELQFGEWTMDLAAAQHLAADQGGYVMAMVSGSLWCPNCTNFEYNLLTLDRDGTGKSRFERWAKDNKVALVEIDMGRFMTGADETTPTLLSKELGKSGFYASGKASGLGYLTRKEISDEKAAEVYARNCELSKKYAVDGGFFGPEDLEDKNCTPYRPRVPCFCLFRADGTCASRLTRFSFPTTPKAADQKWLDNYMKRFDEMLAIAGEGKTVHADKTELGNDYASAHSTPLAANGGKVTSELCCADLRDTFKLTGFTGNGILTARVYGESTAKVQVSFWKMTDGKAEMVSGAYASKELNVGVTKELAAGPGDYYVQVRASNYTTPEKTIAQLDPEFNPTNATPMNFIKYTLSTTVVLTPQDSRAEGVPPADSKLVTVRLVEGATYRLEGMDPEATESEAAFEPLTDGSDHLYVAKVGGDAEIACLKTGTEGGKLVYQTWTPGKVGFEPDYVTTPVKGKKEPAKDTTITRREDEDVTVGIRRVEGVSGDVKIRVSLNVDETDFFYDWAPEAGFNTKELSRFTLDGEKVSGSAGWSREISWTDDIPLANCVSNIAVAAAYTETSDISKYFGPGKVTFDLEILEQAEAGACTNMVDNGRFVINFTDPSKQNAGKAAVMGVDREWAKKLTVYAREDEVVTFDVGRVEGMSGSVAADIKKSVASVTLGGDYDPMEAAVLGAGFGWANRETAVRTITVTNLPPAGKSVKLTLAAKTSGFGVLSASNSLTIVSVATNAPAFAQATGSATLYRYVAASNVYAVTDTVEGGTLSFKKISGTLPSGLKVGWDEQANAMAVYGIPTGNDKAGKTYTAVYQVTEKRPKTPGSKSTVSVPGLTIELTYKVVDPAYAGTGKEGKALNDSCGKARTFKDLMIFDEDLDGETMRLLGTVQLTLPATGKASAKFLCESGTVSFAAKGWDKIDLEGGSLETMLVGTTKNFKDWTMGVVADPNGEVHLRMSSSSATYNTLDFGKTPWSKAHSAADYNGYYTVTLAPATDDAGTPIVTGAGKAYAPLGSGYVTLKKMSSSQENSGTVTWAGILPNGTGVSGSGVLAERTDKLVWLPMVKFSTKDKFTGVVEVARGAAAAEPGAGCWESVSTPTWNEATVCTWWRHTENSTKTDKNEFTVRYTPYGGIYDSSYELKCCCDLEGRSTDMTLTVVLPDGFASDSYGEFKPVEQIDVTVGEHSITRADSAGGANKITLSYTKSTGIVSGKFDLHYTDAKTQTDKKLSASYAGVIQLGYGDECGCETSLPFVNGCWYVTDKIGYDWDEAKGVFKKWLSSVKRGGAVTIEPNKAE